MCYVQRNFRVDSVQAAMLNGLNISLYNKRKDLPLYSVTNEWANPITNKMARSLTILLRVKASLLNVHTLISTAFSIYFVC